MSLAELDRFFDNLHLLADAPDGVAKLRELILDLAVRGKLVEQDANDEPANRLLERGNEERAKLVCERKFSSSRPLPSVEAAEMTFELPRGWAWVRMSHVADHRLGKMLDKGKNKGKPYLYLRNTNVQWLDFDLDDIKEMRFEKDELDEYEVREGDLLVCEGGEPGRCAIWDGRIKPIMFQKAIHRVRPLANINPWFLQYRLLADAKSGYLDQHLTGATIKHFTGKELARYVFALPPLAEQRRIVAKVDELLGRVDQLEAARREERSARERASRSALASLTAARSPAKRHTAWHRLQHHFEPLFATPETLAHLRQAILQLAVQGQLVPQNPDDEPASELAKKIAIAKKRQMEETSIQNTASVAPVDKESAPYPIPQAWKWVRLGDLGVFYGGGTPSKTNSAYWDGPIPWVSPKDMKRAYIDDASDHISELGIESSSARLIPKGSLLMVIRGMILAHSFPVAISKRQLAINQDMKALGMAVHDLNEWLLLVCQGDKSRMLEKVLRSSHGTCRIDSDNVTAFPIPLPPLAEQKRIVAKVDQLLSQCDELDAGIRQRQAASQALLASLVHHLLNAQHGPGSQPGTL